MKLYFFWGVFPLYFLAIACIITDTIGGLHPRVLHQHVVFTFHCFLYVFLYLKVVFCKDTVKPTIVDNKVLLFCIP